MVIQGFENEGWDIQIASNGKEALNILAQRQGPNFNGYSNARNERL